MCRLSAVLVFYVKSADLGTLNNHGDYSIPIRLIHFLLWYLKSSLYFETSPEWSVYSVRMASPQGNAVESIPKKFSWPCTGRNILSARHYRARS